MCKNMYLLLCLPLFIGCLETIEISNELCKQDMRVSPTQQDMLAAAHPCPAAKGLPGVNHLCVDFADPGTKLDGVNGLTAQGWDFRAGAGATCPGWQISSGKLQRKDLSTPV